MSPALKNFLIPQLRKISHKWGAFDEAKRRDRVDKAVDPATGRLCWRVQCATCNDLLFEKHRKLDHIHPVVPVTGWDTLDGFAVRLFCDGDGAAALQSLCKTCHDSKSASENEKRRTRK